MQPPDQEYVPAHMQIAGLHAYRGAIAEMLCRLAAEQLVARLWSRDPSLWYPAAETQARIRARLGWLDLPAADSEQSDDWLALLRSCRITDLLYVGTSDAGVIARLWQDLAAQQDMSRLTVLDSIEPSAVQSTLAAIDWERTAIMLAAESDLAPDIDALARIVLAARAQVVSANAPPLAVIAPPASALLPLVKSYAEATLLPLPPDLGARFGPLSLPGLVPAALLGWQLERLRSAALDMWEQCNRHDDLTLNPGAWLGTTLAVLAQGGRDKLTLLASPELLPLARWIAAFISGSLSKHGRGFVTVVGERRTGALPGALWAEHPAEHPANKEQESKHVDGRDGQGQNRSVESGDRIVVALRLAGGQNGDLDQERARLEAAGLPVVTLELADRYMVAGQIVMWQIAVATIGVVIGLNPFDEPDTAARDAYLWRRLHAGASRSLPPATPLEPVMLAQAWHQLSPTIASARCITIAAYLPDSADVRVLLDDLRTLLGRRFGVTAVVIDPLRAQAFATQVLHAGRPCAILLLTAHAAPVVAVPGRDWTLNDLRHERIAADLLAWTRLERRFVHLDLGSDAAHGLWRCLDLLAALGQ